MQTIRRLATEERGVTIVLVAVMLLVLLGMAAMAIDVGDLLWTRRALQNAVDAAALAGVRELPKDPGNAVLVARRYLEDNLPGATDVISDIRVTTLFAANPNDSIRVTASRTRPPLLRDIPAMIFGKPGPGAIDVPASAQAVVAPRLPTCNYFPWAINRKVIDYDHWKATGDLLYLDWDQSYGKRIMLRAVMGRQLLEEPGNTGIVCFIDRGGENQCNKPGYIQLVKEKGCLTDYTVYQNNGEMKNATPDAILNDVDSAIRQCMPHYDPASGLPPRDCVHWQTDGTDPFGENLPYSNGCQDYYYGGTSEGCGKCTPAGQRVHVSDDSCARVGFLPVIDGWDKNSAVVERAAAFYLIGVEEDKAGHYFVVGAFLELVEASSAPPRFGAPLGPVRDYLLWN